MEIELPDGLTDDPGLFYERINGLYCLAESAVDRQIEQSRPEPSVAHTSSAPVADDRRDDIIEERPARNHRDDDELAEYRRRDDVPSPRRPTPGRDERYDRQGGAGDRRPARGGDDRFAGKPPRNGKELWGWAKHEGLTKQLNALARAWNQPESLSEWNDGDAVDAYHELVVKHGPGSAREVNGRNGSSNGHHYANGRN